MACVPRAQGVHVSRRVSPYAVACMILPRSCVSPTPGPTTSGLPRRRPRAHPRAVDERPHRRQVVPVGGFPDAARWRPTSIPAAAGAPGRASDARAFGPMLRSAQRDIATESGFGRASVAFVAAFGRVSARPIARAAAGAARVSEAASLGYRGRLRAAEARASVRTIQPPEDREHGRCGRATRAGCIGMRVGLGGGGRQRVCECYAPPPPARPRPPPRVGRWGR